MAWFLRRRSEGDLSERLLVSGGRVRAGAGMWPVAHTGLWVRIVVSEFGWSGIVIANDMSESLGFSASSPSAVIS